MGLNPLPPLVIMGVSGCGKSTIGSLLGERLGLPFQDGDDLHPSANKEKMRAGLPLDDTDRLPWLDEIGRRLRESWDSGTAMIVACSALQRSYRDLLRRHAPDLVFVHLAGDRDVLLTRMAARNHEFMPSSLLDSQLATLQPLSPDEPHVLADFTLPPEQLLDRIAQGLKALSAARA